jgi:hypothetical protein
VFDTIVCTDNVDCTDDTCEAATGCKFTANHSKCNDAKACTTDICNPSAGCEHGNAQDGTLCPGGDNYECLTGTCVCMPECGNNECGSNGCGGSCGSCDPDENCVNGECVEPYACADILQCALGCNFSMECTNSCYGNASDSSKQVFTALALCIATQCGFVVDQGCYLQAAQGPCVIQASTCLTD